MRTAISPRQWQPWAQKRYLFFGFKRSHERHKKVPFLQLEAMFSKARKRYLFGSRKWRCSLKREKGTFLAVGSEDVLKSTKKVPLKSLKM